ncbi:MAG: ribbon-helix-helix domain-containing protein [Bifidobacterium longum]
MRRSTKRAVKLYAVEHDKTMQSVLEEALQRLLAEKSMK